MCCWSACDVDKDCRGLLVAHVGPASPLHAHGDLLARYPGRTCKKLEKVRATFLGDIADSMGHDQDFTLSLIHI
eukprot:3386756-Alexandrium_andersonii.AAC.1